MDTSLKDVQVPNLNFDDFDRTGWSFSLMCLQYDRFTRYAGAGSNVCYTAFAGVALKYPVAMRCSRLLLSRTQGGVTDIRACTCVD